MIKPIQTRYAGYLFRSRLEARWAVFFDHLKLDWAYEPEGFQLPSGTYYLPDFRVNLRRGPMWFEIKPGEAESELFDEFITHAPKEFGGAVLNDIPDPRFVRDNHGAYYSGRYSDRPYMRWGGADETEGGGWDNHYRFCICEACGEVGFEFDGRSARIGCGCSIHQHSDKDYTPDHPRIVAAFAAARSARFEHEHREVYA